MELITSNNRNEEFESHLDWTLRNYSSEEFNGFVDYFLKDCLKVKSIHRGDQTIGKNEELNYFRIDSDFLYPDFDKGKLYFYAVSSQKKSTPRLDQEIDQFLKEVRTLNNDYSDKVWFFYQRILRHDHVSYYELYAEEKFNLDLRIMSVDRFVSSETFHPFLIKFFDAELRNEAHEFFFNPFKEFVQASDYISMFRRGYDDKLNIDLRVNIARFIIYILFLLLKKKCLTLNEISNEYESVFQQRFQDEFYVSVLSRLVNSNRVLYNDKTNQYSLNDSEIQNIENLLSNIHYMESKFLYNFEHKIGRYFDL